MSNKAPNGWEHPVRRRDVQDAIERWTSAALAATDGTGRVSVEFDFHEWTAVQATPAHRGKRMPLTAQTRRR